MIRKCAWCGNSFNDDFDDYWVVPNLGWVCCQKCYLDACNANGVNSQTGEVNQTRSSNFQTNGATWKFKSSNKLELWIGAFSCTDPWTTGKLQIMVYHSPTQNLDYNAATYLGGTSLDPLRKGNQYNDFTYNIDLNASVPNNRYILVVLEEEFNGTYYARYVWNAIKPGQIDRKQKSVP
ncbi:MAG: hypothetical protein IKQ61_13110 [Spirochaetales bacterium]|nr:hypothetical protein [Spirochaetales bacterium]MBR6201191.1 hypothetical protein [Spirochaetales bacterium]